MKSLWKISDTYLNVMTLPRIGIKNMLMLFWPVGISFILLLMKHIPSSIVYYIVAIDCGYCIVTFLLFIFLYRKYHIKNFKVFPYMYVHRDFLSHNPGNHRIGVLAWTAEGNKLFFSGSRLGEKDLHVYKIPFNRTIGKSLAFEKLFSKKCAYSCDIESFKSVLFRELWDKLGLSDKNCQDMNEKMHNTINLYLEKRVLSYYE